MAVTNPPGNADFNGDGGVDGADTEAFFLAWEGGLPSADINNDGAVDIADIAAFDDIWEAGETPQAGLCMLTAIRVGYAGYQWDGSVNNDRTVSGTMAGLYHVRHRVYDPELGRWTRRDPIGYVDGRNLQEYVGGRALARIDDSGLRSVSGAAVGAVGSIFINPSEPSDCPIGYHLDPRRNQCVRDVGFQDGLPIARVCCRRIRVNYAPTWMVHCEIVSSPPFYSCEEWASPDPVERQYPTRRSSAGQLPDGTPCSQASSSAIWNCLRVNPHSDGNVRPDSNCQTSVIDRQNKCCITSGFYRNWYAHPTAYVPPACTGRLFWRWLLDLD